MDKEYFLISNLNSPNNFVKEINNNGVKEMNNGEIEMNNGDSELNTPTYTTEVLKKLNKNQKQNNIVEEKKNKSLNNLKVAVNEFKEIFPVSIIICILIFIMILIYINRK